MIAAVVVRGVGAEHFVFHGVNGRGNSFRYSAGFPEETHLIAVGICGGGGGSGDRRSRCIRSRLRMAAVGIT